MFDQPRFQFLVNNSSSDSTLFDRRQDKFNLFGLNQFELQKEQLNRMFQNEGPPLYLSGIQKDRLINQSSLLDILECMLCQKILFKPEECTVCQKSFCFPCISKWKRGSTQCPTGCRQFSTQKAHRTTRNLLNKLMLKCSFHSYGCKEQITHDLLDSHEKDCDYKPVYCPAYADCGFKTIQKKLPAHKADCGYIREKCEQCGKMKQKRHLPEHIQVCEMRLVRCVAYDKCFQQIYLKDLRKHESECNFVEIKCFKCDKKMFRQEKAQHNCANYLIRQLQDRKDQINNKKKTKEKLMAELEESQRKQQEEMVFVTLIFFLLGFLCVGLLYEQAHSWLLDKINIYKLLQPNQCLNEDWRELDPVETPTGRKLCTALDFFNNI